MAIKLMKRRSASLLEKCDKSKLRDINSYPSEWPSSKISTKIKCCPGHGEQGILQSTEFSRPEYWSRYPFPSPGDLPNPGTEPRSPALQADSLPAESPRKAPTLWMGR